MALSQTCIERHSQEAATSRRWICWGLVCAAGLHAALIPLFALRPNSAKEAKESEHIALIVTTPRDSRTLIDADTKVKEPLAEPEQLPPSSNLENSEESENLKETQQIEESEKPDPPRESEEPEKPEVPEEPKEPQQQSNSSSNTANSDNQPGNGPTTQSIATEEGNSSGDARTVALTSSSNPRIVVPSNSNAVEGTESKTTAAGTTEAEEGPEERTAATQGDSGEPSSADVTQTSSQFGCRNCVTPDYPEVALNDEFEGRPDIEFEVDEEGNVINAHIAQSSGNNAIDQAALEAIRRSTFTAGGQGRSRIIQVDFSIEGSERNRAAQSRGEQRTIEESAAAQPASSTPIAEPSTERTSSSPAAATVEIESDSSPTENISTVSDENSNPMDEPSLAEQTETIVETGSDTNQPEKIDSTSAVPSNTDESESKPTAPSSSTPESDTSEQTSVPSQPSTPTESIAAPTHLNPQPKP